MTLRGRFVPEQDLALFLDVDGTLLEIAATPDAVRVPASLRNTLELASQREQGALALVSGRTIASLDELFAPSQFPMAGQHGLERRSAAGALWRAPINEKALSRARDHLQTLQVRHAGLLLEDKGCALALHYRQTPALAEQLTEELETLQQELAPHLQLKLGKCVLELMPAGFSKRTAIEAFMREAPFAGRIPVFVGDDITDEDGFAAVNELGGYSIRVGEPTINTAARHFFGSVSGVIAWLRERNLTPPRQM
jgi:trehalose 6-phosphate phosphatase